MRSGDERDRDQNLNQDRPWFVYTLHDPRDPDMVRYVGWATNTRQRLQRHLSDARSGRDRTYCGRWKRMLLASNVVPVLVVVDSGQGDGWKTAEQKWVAHFKSLEHRLTNLTDGGDGTRGYTLPPERRRKLTPEQKAKIGAANRGRKHSAEARENMRLAHLGRQHTPEQTAKIAAANRGRKMPAEEKARRTGYKMSPEAVAKGAAARRGKKRSQEFAEKMSAALTGRTLSPEHVAKVVAAHTGKKRSPETRARIAQSIREWHAKRKQSAVG